MQRAPAIVVGVIAVAVLAVLAFVLLGGQFAPAADASPSTAASADASAPAHASADLEAELLDRRWTVLYVGTDLNERREEEGLTPSTDALLLVSVAADGSEVAMVSLPRDTVDVPLPDGGIYEGKINAMYADRGIDALVGAMEELYQVPIDGYVLLDMDDFTELVAAVDGVDVNPPEPLEDPIVDLDIEAGPQELDAATAEAYVRTRVDQDYGRMGRQQEVMASLIERLTDPDRPIDLRGVLDGLDSLQTDLPLEHLPTLMEVARRATDAELRNLVIRPPLITFEGDRNDGRGYILEPDVDAIREEVGGLIGQE